MNRTTWTVLCALALTLSSQAANVAWVSFHSGDNSPDANAAAYGFTQAPDVGYTSLLAANGYNVTRFVTIDNGTPASLAVLNTFDLVIISRSVPSSHYQTSPGEVEAWNGVTAPLMLLNGYVARNSRLGFVTGANLLDITNSISLTINNPAHPIFKGVTLDAGNKMVNPYAGLVTATFTNVVVQQGISVTTDSLADAGTVLATYDTFAGNMIAEWAAGATTARGDTFGGPRLMFLTGSRERSLPSDCAGMYDLFPDGEKMFLNAVDYMVTIPEPSTAVLLALGGLVFLLRRRN